MAQERIEPGARVQVIDPTSAEHGRAARVISREGAPNERRWLIAFEYPTGGMTDFTVAPESALQLLPWP